MTYLVQNLGACLKHRTRPADSFAGRRERMLRQRLHANIMTCFRLAAPSFQPCIPMLSCLLNTYFSRRCARVSLTSLQHRDPSLRLHWFAPHTHLHHTSAQWEQKQRSSCEPCARLIETNCKPVISSDHSASRARNAWRYVTARLRWFMHKHREMTRCRR